MDLKNLRRFVKNSKSDLLTIYSAVDNRGAAAQFNWGDVTAISQLIATGKSCDNLTILINTQGGEIQAALGLMEYLRSQYSGKITSVVLNIAKSSGAFLALSSDECYMHCDAVVSDFTIYPHASTTPEEYGIYMETCYTQFEKGVANKLSDKEAIAAYFKLTNCFENHGADITLAEISHTLKGVTDTKHHNHLIYHLVTAHNDFHRELEREGGPAKLIGFNDKILFP